MGNALKFFSNKSLLEIDNFETSELRNRFHELADVLLNQSLVEIGENKYRICEIEFYAHSENHQDPFAHKHPEQLKFGDWYFHQVETKSGFSYKGGNFKGIDLTLGNGKSYVGVLIRSVEPIVAGERIDGPSLVVDEFLSCLKADSVSTVAKSDESGISLILSLSLKSREFFMGPRVGLHPRSDNGDLGLQFIFMPFRYITEPSKAKKGKALLFLHQVSLYGKEKAIQRIGIRDAESKKYLMWFANGLKKSVKEIQLGDSVEKNCTYFGAHYAYFDPDSTSETTEVTPEQLHEMAVTAFREGDTQQLKYLCDLGVVACGSAGLGLEFLKLRGIFFAQSGDLANARIDLLTVLEVNPNDEIAFSNYITACLDANDRSSAVKAIEQFYSSFSNESKGIILCSIKEAIRVGTLMVEELPDFAITDLAEFLKVKSSA